jgi:hypothetical protein
MPFLDCSARYLFLVELVGAFSSFRRREMVGRFANDDLYFTPEKVLDRAISFVLLIS